MTNVVCIESAGSFRIMAVKRLPVLLPVHRLLSVTDQVPGPVSIADDAIAYDESGLVDEFDRPLLTANGGPLTPQEIILFPPAVFRRGRILSAIVYVTEAEIQLASVSPEWLAESYALPHLRAMAPIVKVLDVRHLDRDVVRMAVAYEVSAEERIMVKERTRARWKR